MNYDSLSREDLIELHKLETAKSQNWEERFGAVLFELEKLKRLIYGTKSERFIPDDQSLQGTLFDLPAPPPVEEESEKEKIEYERTKAAKAKHPGRNELPAHLPRVDIVLEPEGLTEDMKRIGDEVTETLDYTPASLVVIRTIRPKYVVSTPSDQGTATKAETIVIASLPERPIDKSIAEIRLLIYIVVSKYLDHIPLHRLAKIFKRDKVDLSESTLGGWVTAIANLLKPLYDTMIAELLKSDYIQGDESRIQVMDPTVKGKTHRGYYWVYHAPVIKSVVFQYCTGRGAVHPFKLLKDYSGRLQCDGYTAYGVVDDAVDTIQLAGCWAHVRRKFEEARSNDKVRAEWMLSQIQKMYAVERRAKEQNLTAEERKEMRKELTQPIINDIDTWLNANRPGENPQVLPKSPIGMAINYTLGQWKKLIVFADQGDIEIDNNWVENKIRPLAIGRKNYLFAGSHDAAQRAAIFYSFFATCELNGVNPAEWLEYVLKNIKGYSIQNLKELLPANWAAKRTTKLIDQQQS